MLNLIPLSVSQALSSSSWRPRDSSRRSSASFCSHPHPSLPSAELPCPHLQAGAPGGYLYHEGVGVVSLSLLSFFSSTQVTLAGPQPGADRGDTPRAATLRARQQACLGIRDRGCILILIWQGDLLGRPICTDPSSLASRVVLLRAKGQLCALLSPLAGLLLCKGSRCCLLFFF